MNRIAAWNRVVETACIEYSSRTTVSFTVSFVVCCHMYDYILIRYAHEKNKMKVEANGFPVYK